MTVKVPLRGVRIQLAAAVPDDATAQEAQGICDFVRQLSLAVFSEGGTVVHGSHPSLAEPLKEAAESFARAGGRRDALTLVRTHTYAQDERDLQIIAKQRHYASVHIIPESPHDPTKSLVPMREWMSERSDVVVAVGGKWFDINKARAGVPIELEDAMQRGIPAFVIAGFGGATSTYLKEDGTVFSRLRNGLSESENQALAGTSEVQFAVDRVIEQLKRLPLVRENVQSSRLFRILALDGGGLRGAFTAAVLAKWDDMLGKGGGNSLVKNFDLVAGTSTGAILAIGLGVGLTPLQILKFYREKGSQIFPSDRKLRHWLKSKHNSQTLEDMLKTVFADKTLSKDSCCRLVIPTVRAVRGESDVIVTAHTSDRTAYRDLTAVQAALASSAAPTYFDEAHISTDISTQAYLDGGIWANNPILPAISEAVRHLKIPLDRIDVLSVGTMGCEVDFTDALGKGKLGWSTSSVDLFFAAQEHASVEIANSLLTPARHLRVNQQTPTPIPLDDVGAIKDLIQRGDQLGASSFAAVRSRFLDGFHAPDWREELADNKPRI